MDKRHVGAALCVCVALLALGLALGRYSALKNGAVITGGGGALASMGALEVYAASAGGQEVSVKIDLNAAGADALTELPGIGGALAARIVEYRETNGRFESIEEIMAVRGIGESVFSKIRDYIFVD